MRNKISPAVIFLSFAACFLMLACININAQLTSGTDINLSQKTRHDSECAIAKNPTNKLQLFASCNTDGTGMLAARSTNGGATWIFPDPADKTIADGDAGQGPAACCDPTLAWDRFGNLFVTYINNNLRDIETLISTDGGATFSNLATFVGPCFQCVDQPTVVVPNTNAAGAAISVWVVWNQKPNAATPGSMVARGAAVTGSGVAGVGAFNAIQTAPGSAGCSFGDIAISPAGAVVQACQNPTTGQGPATIFVNTDADGLGAGPFGAAVAATVTNVGGFDFIPAQNARSIDAEAGLAYDLNALSPHVGRLYLVYTDEVGNESNDTDIMMRFSDNDGATWSNPPIRVNDDAPGRSQFLPRVAVNGDSGNIAVCWHDSRNSAGNTAMQEFCAISNRTLFPAFIAAPVGVNIQTSDGASTSNGTANPGNAALDFGDYSGMTYFRGRVHPIWADSSNSTGNNPDMTTRFDAYTDIVSGGAAAMEGDPHITTVNGVAYDFQSAGEFTVLRDADGLEIQARQTPISTTSTLGPNGHTGLTTCVSLNSAVAAKVGSRRVTYQPNLSGLPDPSGMQLRVDGSLVTLGPGGLNLGPDGRISRAGDGIRIDFPNETVLVVTPLFWDTYGVWFLNINVSHTSAVLGVMGAITPGTWLPRRPNGGSFGAKPVSLHQRYIDLYEKFADAWRVNNTTTLFDYAPGTSTATFTTQSWPMENQQCVIPSKEAVKPLNPERARLLCRGVTGKARQADCIFDVTVTGEPAFAKLYLLTQRVHEGLTTTIVSVDNAFVKERGPTVFTATVVREAAGERGAPAGTVQFFVDGERAGKPLKLNPAGQADFKTEGLKEGRHVVSAQYFPALKSIFLASNSDDLIHVVRN